MSTNEVPPIALPEEEWRRIDDTYSVSSAGRVWSWAHARLLSPRPTNRGYVQVSLHRKNHTLARLVLTAFDQPKPSGAWVVDFGNGDRSDCSLANLARKLRADIVFEAAHRTMDHEFKPGYGMTGRRCCMTCTPLKQVSENERSTMMANQSKDAAFLLEHGLVLDGTETADEISDAIKFVEETLKWNSRQNMRAE